MPFPYVMIILVLNFLHHSSSVLEADLVCNSHFSGGGLAHTVEEFVEHIYLFLAQRLLKRDTELAEIVRKQD